MVTRASPKREDDGKFFTALPAKAGEESDMVVAAILIDGGPAYSVFCSPRMRSGCGDGLR
uniref:Uncharacterized protein n=1 Tax=Triticum urartu TaxID=4572 RepID=A0A8R7QH07_TRIUA